MLASAIARVIDGQPDLTVRGIARSGSDAAMLAARENADVALLDFQLPDVSGPAAAGMIQSSRPGTAIVFHSAEESESYLLDAIDAGAMAYLTKSAAAEQIVEAVRRAAQGDQHAVPLDRREPLVVHGLGIHGAVAGVHGQQRSAFN